MGRIPIYEFLLITPELADILRTNDTNLFIKTVREQANFKTLSQFVFDRASEGITTLAEVFKISGEVF